MNNAADPRKLSPFGQPAEWEMHEAVWSAWPSAAHLWQEELKPAQDEFTALCRAIDDQGRGERLEICVPDAKSRADAEKALKGLNVRFHDIPFGDIWFRDTAPIFTRTGKPGLEATRFAFNGWGEKYDLPHDKDVSTAITRAVAAQGVSARAFPFVLEGGSVEVDGEGTCLTTRQCLLNENRNPGMTEAQIEDGLMSSLGVKKILWLGDGLLNDHTDGHIDTIARFVAPGVVVCMESHETGEDPNRGILNQIARDLSAMTDAQGRKLQVVRIPSPGVVRDEDGEIMPASYVNFYISNTAVVVPVYGSRFDAAAVEAIGKLFPTRKTVGLLAKSILAGGGAFHCITQQQPLPLR